MSIHTFGLDERLNFAVKFLSGRTRDGDPCNCSAGVGFGWRVFGALGRRALLCGPLCGAAVAIATIVASPAAADVTITMDRGGSLVAYQARVDAFRASGERVIVDGPCYSACTLYLTLPQGQVCATRRAVFGFHSVLDEQFGLPVPAANDRLMKAYPPNVQLEIGKRGGLWLNLILIRGTALVKGCGK